MTNKLSVNEGNVYERITPEEKTYMQEQLDLQTNLELKNYKNVIEIEWRDANYIVLKDHIASMEEAIFSSGDDKVIAALNDYITTFGKSKWTENGGKVISYPIALYQALLYKNADDDTKKDLGNFGPCGCGVDGVFGLKTLLTSGKIIKPDIYKDFHGVVDETTLNALMEKASSEAGEQAKSEADEVVSVSAPEQITDSSADASQENAPSTNDNGTESKVSSPNQNNKVKKPVSDPASPKTSDQITNEQTIDATTASTDLGEKVSESNTPIADASEQVNPETIDGQTMGGSPIDLPEAVAVIDAKKAEYQASKLDAYMGSLQIDVPTAEGRGKRKREKQQEVFNGATTALQNTIKGLFDKDDFDAALPTEKKEMMHSFLTRFDAATKTTLPELNAEKERIRKDISSLLEVGDAVYTYEMNEAKQYTELDGYLAARQTLSEVMLKNNDIVTKKVQSKQVDMMRSVKEYTSIREQITHLMGVGGKIEELKKQGKIPEVITAYEKVLTLENNSLAEEVKIQRLRFEQGMLEGKTDFSDITTSLESIQTTAKDTKATYDTLQATNLTYFANINTGLFDTIVQDIDTVKAQVAKAPNFITQLTRVGYLHEQLFVAEEQEAYLSAMGDIQGSETEKNKGTDLKKQIADELTALKTDSPELSALFEKKDGMYTPLDQTNKKAETTYFTWAKELGEKKDKQYGINKKANDDNSTSIQNEQEKLTEFSDEQTKIRDEAIRTITEQQKIIEDELTNESPDLKMLSEGADMIAQAQQEQQHAEEKLTTFYFQKQLTLQQQDYGLVIQFTDEVSALSAQIAQKNKQLTSYTSQKEALQQKRENIVEEIDALMELSASARVETTTTTLLTELVTTQDALQNIEDTKIIPLKKEISDLVSEKNQKQTLVDYYDQRIVFLELHAQHQITEKRIKEYGAAIENLTTRKSGYKSQISKLTEENNTLLAETKTLKQKAKNLASPSNVNKTELQQTLSLITEKNATITFNERSIDQTYKPFIEQIDQEIIQIQEKQKPYLARQQTDAEKAIGETGARTLLDTKKGVVEKNPEYNVIKPLDNEKIFYNDAKKSSNTVD